MRLPRECYQMRQTIGAHLPHLSPSQLTGLTWWVCGTVWAGSPPPADQNAVAAALSMWGSWHSRRQYLREWLYDGSDPPQADRTELDVSLCFAPLLKWVLSWWCGNRLALAIDPTLKGDDAAAIVISVLPGLRHSGSPVSSTGQALAHPEGQTSGVLDGSDSGTAASPGDSGARRNDRNRAV